MIKKKKKMLVMKNVIEKVCCWELIRSGKNVGEK